MINISNAQCKCLEYGEWPTDVKIESVLLCLAQLQIELTLLVITWPCHDEISFRWSGHSLGMLIEWQCE